MPEGSSLIPFFHYGQLHLLNFSFVHYDYGSMKQSVLSDGNLDIPPPYNLNNVITPTAMFVGAGDTTADPGDNEVLSKDLPNVFHYEVSFHMLGGVKYFGLNNNLRELLFCVSVLCLI